jgi:DNA sulfur modification protein DndB
MPKSSDTNSESKSAGKGTEGIEVADFVPVQTTAEKFEEDVRSLLKKLDFENVDGGRTFKINGIQVDACAGWENALLIIECKTKQTLGKKSLRSYISEMRGKQKILEEGFAANSIYKKYTFFKHLLITRNIKIRKEDYDFANERPSIYIGNDDFLQYYSDLYGLIKPYAKYSLLGELRIRRVKAETISAPALRTRLKLNDKEINMYTFLINPHDLLEVSYVARREIGRERYYQRTLKGGRIHSIARYLMGGNGIANNIIIAFDEELKRRLQFHTKNSTKTTGLAEWPYLTVEFGILEFPKDYRSCWIVDGQHRLYAFAHVGSELMFTIPVTAFENLELKEQRKFFLDINGNQKPVESDLLWDLRGDVTNDSEGIISNVVKLLNNETRSPLHYKIYYPSTGIKKKKDYVKISTLCIAIKRYNLVDSLLERRFRNPLYNKQPELLKKNINDSMIDYFKTLESSFHTNWEYGAKGFILSNGGIAVMIGLYEKIIARIMEKDGREADEKDFIYYTNPLKGILEISDTQALKSLRLKATSEGGRKEMLNEFSLRIRSTTTDNLFGGIIEKPYSDQFSNLELKLKEIIKNKCDTSGDKEWLKNVVDQTIYGRALKNISKRGINGEENAYLGLDLGQCVPIIKTNIEKFSAIFIGNEDFQFTKKEDFIHALDFVTRTRNEVLHPVPGAKIKPSDKKRLDVELESIYKCIENYQ